MENTEVSRSKTLAHAGTWGYLVLLCGPNSKIWTKIFVNELGWISQVFGTIIPTGNNIILFVNTAIVTRKSGVNAGQSNWKNLWRCGVATKLCNLPTHCHLLLQGKWHDIVNPWWCILPLFQPYQYPSQWTPLFEWKFRRPTKQWSHQRHLQDNGKFCGIGGWGQNRLLPYQCQIFCLPDNLPHQDGELTTPHQAPNWQHHCGGLLQNHSQAKISKAIDMSFCWLQDRKTQGRINIFWCPWKCNLGDYQTKHHLPSHQRIMRSKFLHTEQLINNLQLCHMQGCVKSRVNVCAHLRKYPRRFSQALHFLPCL